MEIVENKKSETKTVLKKLGGDILIGSKALSKAQCNKFIAKLKKCEKEGKINNWEDSKSKGVWLSEGEDWKKEDKLIFEVVGNTLKMVHKELDLPITIATNDRGYWLIRNEKGFKYGPSTDVQMPHNLIIEIFLDDQSEYHFPKQDVTVKGKAGDILIYPMFWTHLFEVKEVQEPCHAIKTLVYANFKKND